MRVAGRRPRTLSRMTVLALDTASPRAAVAVHAAGRLAEEPLAPDRRASEELLAAVERLLARVGSRLADCSRVAVCSGPGSFTGVRVGLATAWGFGRALGIPIEPVSTLEAMAEAARDASRPTCLVVLDAGRGERIVRRFALDTPRARPLGETLRVPAADVARLAGADPIVALPRELCAGAYPLATSPAAAMAAAVARSPALAPDSGLRATYARPSAAEEKRGAS
jgi:tRNA threonylcarbamoyladenosine biosynthesis protein TsaB